MIRSLTLGLSVLFVVISAGRLQTDVHQPSDPGTEGLKEFVKILDKIDLNVTLVISSTEYKDGAPVDQIISSISMPVNKAQLSQPTLDEKTMSKFLKRIEKLSKEEAVAARYEIYNEGKLIDYFDVNDKQLIDAGIDSTLLDFSKRSDPRPLNESGLVNYHYQISKPGEDGVDNVLITFGICHVEDKEVGKDFSPEVLADLHEVLPKYLWYLNGLSYVNKIVDHLEKKFNKKYQIIEGIDKFGIGTDDYAFLDVGGSKLVIFA